MRRLLIIAMLCVPLGACTWLANTFGGTPSQNTKTTIVEVFTDSCNAYASALQLATQAMTSNLLTEAQIADIDKARQIATPICTGTQPTNLAAAWLSVTEALASISADTGKAAQ